MSLAQMLYSLLLCGRAINSSLLRVFENLRGLQEIEVFLLLKLHMPWNLPIKDTFVEMMSS